MAGVDWQLGEHVVLGAAAGNERLDTRLYDRSSRARLRGHVRPVHRASGTTVSRSVAAYRVATTARATREVPLLARPCTAARTRM